MPRRSGWCTRSTCRVVGHGGAGHVPGRRRRRTPERRRSRTRTAGPHDVARPVDGEPRRGRRSGRRRSAAVGRRSPGRRGGPRHRPAPSSCCARTARPSSAPELAHRPCAAPSSDAGPRAAARTPCSCAPCRSGRGCGPAACCCFGVGAGSVACGGSLIVRVSPRRALRPSRQLLVEPAHQLELRTDLGTRGGTMAANRSSASSSGTANDTRTATATVPARPIPAAQCTINRSPATTRSTRPVRTGANSSSVGACRSWIGCHTTRDRRLRSQPRHVVRVPLGEFVLVVETHHPVGADARHQPLGIGPDRVLAAQPQPTPRRRRQWDLVDAAVEVHVTRSPLLRFRTSDKERDHHDLRQLKQTGDRIARAVGSQRRDEFTAPDPSALSTTRHHDPGEHHVPASVPVLHEHHPRGDDPLPRDPRWAARHHERRPTCPPARRRRSRLPPTSSSTPR